jgi:hypothetical protein
MTLFGNSKVRIQVVSIVFLFLATYLNAAYADTKAKDMPDLTTAKLNLECGEFIGGKVPELGFNQGLCIGIILGVEDNASYDKKICVPITIGIQERVIVVRDYIATQPKRMREAFASLAFDALIRKWPCKNSI